MARNCKSKLAFCFKFYQKIQKLSFKQMKPAKKKNSEIFITEYISLFNLFDR